MSLWLILVGVVLVIFGVAVAAAKILIWIGIAVLVVSVVLGLLNRGRSRRVTGRFAIFSGGRRPRVAWSW